jgi:O-antigen/teichoic acid export membrane protein
MPGKSKIFRSPSIKNRNLGLLKHIENLSPGQESDKVMHFIDTQATSMIKIKNIKNSIKSRLGELWWYTIVVFMTQQLGAVVSTFIGLWLVPKYVPKEDLGALLPLAAIGSLLGLPLTILMIPFMKFLTKYMVQEEYGKVKALLRDVFILVGITFLLISALSYLFMPLIFVRMRVENGFLSMLIICTGIMGALAPVFSTALQALKKFKMMSALGFLSTLVRLVTLLIALPIRGLSGYFVGQLIPLLLGVLASLASLRNHLSSNVKMVSYWSEDWKPILKFTAWNALLYSVSQIMVTTEGFVIRHRLTDVESAGYYMISRFAEISFYISSACTVVLFPLISEQHEKGVNHDHRLLNQSTIISFTAGLLFAIAITPFVRFLFIVKSDWTIYLPFIPHLFVLSLLQVIRGSTHSFVLYKTAKNEFGFIPYYMLVFGLEIIVLYSLAGYAFFTPWMPTHWMEALVAFNPCRLSVVLGIIMLHSIAILVYVVTAIVRIQFRSRACPTGVHPHPS